MIIEDNFEDIDNPTDKYCTNLKTWKKEARIYWKVWELYFEGNLYVGRVASNERYKVYHSSK